MKNFILKNNNEEDFDLFEYQGDAYLLLVFFRGVWCNLCKKQLKQINELFDKFQNKNIKILAVSSDTKLRSSLLKKFLSLNFSVLSDAGLDLINHFKLKTQTDDRDVSRPAVILISPKHEVLIKKMGQDYEDLLSGQEIFDLVKEVGTE